MTPILGEIRIFGGNFAPKGWAFCNGQLLNISQNSALFSLLGTTYGGDGRVTFALPDLRGRAPIGFGQGPGLSSYALGEQGGTEAVTLLVTEMPTHNHALGANSANGTSTVAQNNVPATSASRDNQYSPTVNATMSPTAIGPAGGNEPHENRQPYLAMNYIIALEGIYPSRN
jgi:microcystin-dependent protein